MKKYTRIEVTWGDAWTATGWHNPEGSCKPELCLSAGYFLERDRKGLLMALSRSGDKCNGTHFIPKGMIIKIKTLR